MANRRRQALRYRGRHAIIKNQGEDFTGIPAIPAGTRATADSLNYPLSLLTARYAAIVNENEDFLSRINQFLSVLEKDSLLVDQLIAAAQQGGRPPGPLTLAKKFYLDFGASHGAAAISVAILSTHRNLRHACLQEPLQAF